MEEKKDTVGKMIELLRRTYPEMTKDQQKRFRKLLKDYTDVLEGLRKLIEEHQLVVLDKIKAKKDAESGQEVAQNNQEVE